VAGADTPRRENQMRPYTAAILTLLLVNITSAQPAELMRAYILNEDSHPRRLLPGKAARFLKMNV